MSVLDCRLETNLYYKATDYITLVAQYFLIGILGFLIKFFKIKFF